MDNSQQPANDQISPQTMPVPNRGGIPIAPVSSSPTDAQKSQPTDEQKSAPQTPVTQPEEPISASADKTATTPDPAQNTTQSPVQQPSAAPASKEHEPMTAPLPDVAKLSDAEIQEEEIAVEKELESWIEKLPAAEKPKIPEEAKKAGLDHAKEDTPMPAALGMAALPMTFDEAQQIRKQEGRHWYYWRKSVAWFAALVMYHWKKIGLTKEK